MSYQLEEARKLVLEAGLELVEKGLIARTWGNISARISDTQFVITPSGRSYDSLIADDIVIVNIKDCSYDGEIKPSGEMATHAEVYKHIPDVDFVIHTHQMYASAISIMGNDLTNLASYNEVLKEKERRYEEILGDCIPCAKYAISSSAALAGRVKSALKKCPDCKALFLKHHGVVCLGKSKDEAFLVSSALEEVCQSEYEFLTQSFMATANSESETDYGSSYRDDSVIHLTVGDKTASWPAGYLKDSTKSDVPAGIRGIAMLHDMLYQDININYVEHVSNKFTNIISHLEKSIKPYIDDQTQIIGTRLPICKIRIKLHKLRNGNRIKKKLNDTNAILLTSGGALCIGASRDDIDAAASVLEKGCMAAVLAHLIPVIKPVPKKDAKKMREIYLNSYSKLKDSPLTAATLNEFKEIQDMPVPESIYPPTPMN